MTPDKEKGHAPQIDGQFASERWPFPWIRHNTQLRAANGNVVASFPVDGEPLFGGGIAGVVERGDIIETAVNKYSRRRNDWLEKRVALLEGHLKQSVAHWDSVIAGEGTEFGFGVFDSVKDGLEDWRAASIPPSVARAALAAAGGGEKA